MWTRWGAGARGADDGIDGGRSRMVKRMVRALVRAVTGSGWVHVPPVSPFDPGLAVPVPRPVADAPEVPLSKRERETFWRIVSG
jgi:hypothetical protein